MIRRRPSRPATPSSTGAAPDTAPDTAPDRSQPRPPAPEDNIGPWQGMRPPYANPSALPAGERVPRPSSGAPYRDVFAGLPNAIIFLAGVWLLVCPWLIEHPGTALGIDAAVHDVVLGLLLAIVGGARAVSPFTVRWAGWAAIALGGWLIAAPYVLGYAGGDYGSATANDVVTGAVVIVMAVVGMALSTMWRRHG